MASIFISGETCSEIDYSIIDGRVRSFVLHDKKLYDEADGTVVAAWKEKLVELVKHQGLDIPRDGGRHPKFIYWMRGEGLLPIETEAGQDKPLLWSTYSAERAGWCVWKQRPGGVAAEIVAGPFRTRQEADDLLGPLLGQLESPNTE